MSLIKLTALLVFVPVAVYFLSVSDTVNLYKEYCQVRDNSGSVPAAGRTKEFSASAPMLSSGVLMRIISGVCAENKVSVGHFSPEETGREGYLHLVSAQLDLTGDFAGLLKVLARIEEVQNIKTSCAEFMTMKAGKSGKTVRLRLTLMQMEDHRL